MNISNLLDDNTIWMSYLDSCKIDKHDLDDYRLHHLEGIREYIYFFKTFDTAYSRYIKLMERKT